VTTDLIVTLAAIEASAQLSRWLLLLLWNSTERCFSCHQLHRIFLHATNQTFKYSKLQQFSVQQQSQSHLLTASHLNFGQEHGQRVLWAGAWAAGTLGRGTDSYD